MSVAVTPAWSEFLENATLFHNAVRLRHLIWLFEKLVPRGAELLETGFGSGTTAILLADMGYRVTILDRDATLIQRFENRYADWTTSGRISVIHGDMLRLPWTEKRFAVAYHQGVLEHCTDDQIVAALRQQARVAGEILFDVPNCRYDAHPFGDERLLTEAHWKTLIRQAGLHIAGIYGRDFPGWLYAFPFAFFSRTGLFRLPWLGRRFGKSWIFHCRPNPRNAPEKAEP